MRIAILGAGAIGSTLAFQLARAGHDVTVIARGARLAWLEQEGAVVRSDGVRAPVTVAAELDEHVAWDLVLVTVLATQVSAVLPTLRASQARAIVFMFNTFDPIAPLFEAVGAERASFGFPGGVFVLLREGRIHPTIRAGTTVGDARWARVFADAGIPTVLDDDMQSWLRSHAVMVAPLMAASVKVVARGAGVTWREACALADAWRAGVRIVRALGDDLRPGVLRVLFGAPRSVLAALMWAFSRTTMLRELGELGASEPRMLLDTMSAHAPELAGPLRAIRP